MANVVFVIGLIYLGFMFFDLIHASRFIHTRVSYMDFDRFINQNMFEFAIFNGYIYLQIIQASKRSLSSPLFSSACTAFAAAFSTISECAGA